MSRLLPRPLVLLSLATCLLAMVGLACTGGALLPPSPPSATAAGPAVTTSPGPSPSPTPAVPSPGPTRIPQAAACPGPAELAGYWPPAGVLDDPLDPALTVELGDVSFTQVQVLQVVCGDLRDQGNDAYIAAAIPGERVLLAALHGAEGFLVAVGLLVGDRPADTRLLLTDLTGDGRPEIVLEAGTGAKTAVNFAVWSWRQERYAKLLEHFSDYPVDIEDLDGDGAQELVLRSRVLEVPGAAGLTWPGVLRWDGLAFHQALSPGVYEEFIDAAQVYLESKQAPAEEEWSVRTLWGHALQLLGREAQARTMYEQAWAAWSQAPAPAPSLAAVDCVQRYYELLSGPGYPPPRLAAAYAMWGEALRRDQTFAEFAAGFATTLAVRLLEPPRLVGVEDGSSLVNVRLMARDLTPQGEVERYFEGTWQVRGQDGRCLMESATISTPFPTVCLPNPDPANAGLWWIEEPRPGQAVRSPLHIAGRGIYFESGPLSSSSMIPGDRPSPRPEFSSPCRRKEDALSPRLTVWTWLSPWQHPSPLACGSMRRALGMEARPMWSRCPFSSCPGPRCGG